MSLKTTFNPPDHATAPQIRLYGLGAWLISIRGWVACPESQIQKERDIITSFVGKAETYGLTKNGAEMYNKGWQIPDGHINWTYYILTHKYFTLFWLVPGLLAFMTGHPGLNCIEGTMYLVVAVIGLVLTFVFDPHHAIGGVIPGITWGAMGALKGTTMACMEDELKKSKELYERLRDDGTLILRRA